MPINPIVGAGIVAAGGQVLSGVGNMLTANSRQAKNEKFAWDQENVANMRYWERLQNDRDYDSYKNQMLRAKDAGLNPSLVATGSIGQSAGQPAPSATPSPANGRPADLSPLSDAGSTMVNSMLTAARAKSELNSIRVQEANIEYQKAATTKALIDAAKTDQEREQLLRLYDSQIRSAEARASMDESDAYFRPMQNQSNLSHVNTAIDKMRAERKLVIQNIHNAKVERAFKNAGIAHIYNQIAEGNSRIAINANQAYRVLVETGAIQQDMSYKAWAEELRRQGIDPNDRNMVGTVLKFAFGATGGKRYRKDSDYKQFIPSQR